MYKYKFYIIEGVATICIYIIKEVTTICIYKFKVARVPADPSPIREFWDSAAQCRFLMSTGIAHFFPPFFLKLQQNIFSISFQRNILL